MSTKTELWDRLGKTDPKHTSKFQRAGGFKGTAIKPIYSIHRMTEEFGPCGAGWGINEPTFQLVHGNDEVLVYCYVSIWHGTRDNTVFGVGGDKAIGKNRNGAFTDDEAFKKAFTDAITNAMKYIGVSADVHMGLFDDSKYVESVRQNPHVTRPADIFEPVDHDEHGEVIDNIPAPDPDSIKKLRVADQRPIFKELQDEIQATASIKELQQWAEQNRNRLGSLKSDWQDFLRGVYAEHLKALRLLEQGDDMRMAG